MLKQRELPCLLTCAIFFVEVASPDAVLLFAKLCINRLQCLFGVYLVHCVTKIDVILCQLNNYFLNGPFLSWLHMYLINKYVFVA